MFCDAEVDKIRKRRLGRSLAYLAFCDPEIQRDLEGTGTIGT